MGSGSQPLGLKASDLADPDLARIELPDGRTLEFGERGGTVFESTSGTATKFGYASPRFGDEVLPFVTIIRHEDAATISWVPNPPPGEEGSPDPPTFYVVGPCERLSLVEAEGSDRVCLRRIPEDRLADAYARIDDPPSNIEALDPFTQPDERTVALHELERNRWYRFEWPERDFCDINVDLGRIRFMDEAGSVDNFHSGTIRPGFSNEWGQQVELPPLAARYTTDGIIEISDVEGNAGFYYQSEADLSCG